MGGGGAARRGGRGGRRAGRGAMAEAGETGRTGDGERWLAGARSATTAKSVFVALLRVASSGRMLLCMRCVYARDAARDARTCCTARSDADGRAAGECTRVDGCACVSAADPSGGVARRAALRRLRQLASSRSRNVNAHRTHGSRIRSDTQPATYITASNNIYHSQQHISQPATYIIMATQQRLANDEVFPSRHVAAPLTASSLPNWRTFCLPPPPPKRPPSF